jgi:hypothetical protein
MSIRSPALQWPSQLEARGPLEDTTILLTGVASIAGVPHVVNAVRVRPGRRAPDFRDDIGRDKYADLALDALLTHIEGLTNSISVRRVELESGIYILWMLPAADDGRSNG